MRITAKFIHKIDSPIRTQQDKDPRLGDVQRKIGYGGDRSFLTTDSEHGGSECLTEILDRDGHPIGMQRKILLLPVETRQKATRRLPRIVEAPLE